MSLATMYTIVTYYITSKKYNFYFTLFLIIIGLSKIKQE